MELFLRNFEKRIRNFILIFVTITFLAILVQSQDTTGFFHCTDSICTEAIRQNPCPEKRNCSTTGFRTFLDPSECNCCDYCFDYLKENETCPLSSPQKPIEMCGPFLSCQKAEKPSDPSICKIMTENPNDLNDQTFCMRKRKEWTDRKRNGTLGIVHFLPECDAGGNYAPRQCIDGSICYCSNAKGEKIFGETLPGSYQDCACGRDVARLQSFGFKGKMPHCLSNGDYDELQCVGRTCYCRNYPAIVQDIKNLTRLDCFDKSIHIHDPEESTYYMRECELKKAELEIEIEEANLQGIIMIISDIPNCDPDGNYAKIQTKFDKQFCANPENGDILESFVVGKFSLEASNMNCHCSRARHLLRESATGKPQCCRNGNYRPWQRIGSRFYCVDEYGRQDVSIEPYEVYETELGRLSCYRKDDPTCINP